MRKSCLLCIFFFSLFSGISQVQEDFFPQISVKELMQEDKPVRISAVGIDVKVVGSLAVTTVDMTFRNPNNRILEGELTFPLAEGQSVSGFALDINGRLREGVVVEKGKGQAVFETTIRRQIDPGLLEKVQGNNFRTRIYPLPAKGTRRVVITYEQELQRYDGMYRYFLPVEYNDTLENFNVNLTVFSKGDTPVIEQTPWGEFKFDTSGETHVASYAAEKYPAKGQIVFTVPVKDNTPLYIENGEKSGEVVFFSQLFPPVLTKPRPLPSKIDMYWDNSASRTERNVALETELLDHYFKKVKEVTIYLYTFNVVVSEPVVFVIKDGNWNKLKSYLETIPYDGATQLGALEINTSPSDEIWLFSDGISNLGASLPSTGKVPVSVINSSLQADHSLLKYVAGVSGGSYINLMQMNPQDAVGLLQNENSRLISIKYNKKDIVGLATSGTELTPERGFSMAGKLKGKKADITLHFGTGTEISQTYRVTIDKKDVSDYGNLIEKVWAAKKINELDLRYEENKEEIEAIGQKYTIVTRNTSLIVLDDVADYIRHKITPPEELLEEYRRQVQEIEEERKEEQEERLEEVLTLLEKRKEWWNTTFDGKEKEKKQKLYPPSLSPSRALQGRVSAIEDIPASEESLEEFSLRLRENNSSPETEAPLYIVNGVVVSDIHSIDLDDIESVSVLKDAASSAVYGSRASHGVVIISTAGGGIPSDNEVSYSINDNNHAPASGTIRLNVWQSDAPYLSALHAKPDHELYSTYLEIKETYKMTPSFYLDVADVFEKRGLKEEAFVILSNLAELKLEEYRLLRVLAHRLKQLNYNEYAISIFKKVLELRPEEPQSYRDLGLAYIQHKDYQSGIDMLYAIIEQEWDSRFDEIELFAIEEINHAIRKAEREKVKLDLRKIDKRLLVDMPVDIRIVMNWDTDNSDMDLWVTDPYGEQCYYGNPQTGTGGMITEDFTDGYGPEAFLLKKAPGGKYKIQADYFGSREQTLIGPTTIYLDVYTDYSGKNEKKETITLRLTKKEGRIIIGEIEF